MDEEGPPRLGHLHRDKAQDRKQKAKQEQVGPTNSKTR